TLPSELSSSWGRMMEDVRVWAGGLLLKGVVVGGLASLLHWILAVPAYATVSAAAVMLCLAKTGGAVQRALLPNVLGPLVCRGIKDPRPVFMRRGLICTFCLATWCWALYATYAMLPPLSFSDKEALVALLLGLVLEKLTR